MPSNLSENDFQRRFVEEHFSSAGECYKTLGMQYGGITDLLQRAPRFLFRGEDHFYPSSTPGAHRTLTADFPTAIKFARIDATDLFVEDYVDMGGDPLEAECLAQHYLSTSDCLDFSSSLGVALAFALGEKVDTSSRCAYVAVLDKRLADSCNRFCLRDLRFASNALRPVRQYGFLSIHRKGNFVDLKDAETCRGLGLTWFSFSVVPADVDINRHPAAPRLDALYDIKGDLWAARTLQHLGVLLHNPSEQWGSEGLRHLEETQTRLTSRTRC